MADLNATELAAKLDVSKARISQYVSEGKLDGCFVGDGRSRRFDLAKVADALGRRLDLGQMTGNGAGTRRVLRSLGSDDDEVEPREPPQKSGSVLPGTDPDRLELATIQLKEEQARRARRDNERDDGRWVLAEEVQRQTARAMAQEIAQFEAMLRDAARSVADSVGADFREVRKIMMDHWRNHRASRTQSIEDEAGSVLMTEAEKAAQA